MSTISQCLVVLCLLLASGLPSQAQSIVLDESFNGPTNLAALINECCAFVGQTYTTHVTGVLAGIAIDVPLSRSTFPLHVTIRSVAGGVPTTTILGDVTLSSNTSNLSQLIVFPQVIPQVAGVQYAIVVNYQGAPPEGAGQLQGVWSGAIGNGYPGGDFVLSSDGGVSWFTPTPLGDDLHFETFVSSTGISLVQSNAVEGSGVASLAAGFPSNNNAGNSIIAFVRMSTTSQTVTVTDTSGNVYADAVSQVQTADGHQIHLFYARNIRGGPNAVTAQFSGTNNHPLLAIYEFRGLDPSNPLDAVASTQGTGTSPSSGLLTTTNSNELAFAATGLPASYTGTVNPAPGYTLQLTDSQSGAKAANETNVLSSSGQYAGQFSLSASANWTALMATFKSAGTAPGPDFTLSVSPGSQTVTQGSGTTYSVSISAVNGFNSTVNLSVSNLPSGATGSFNPPSVTGSGSSTLTITTASNAQMGTSTITVTGTSNSGMTHSASATFTINPASGGGGSITLVQSNATEGSGLSSISTAFPASNTAGNLIVAFVRMSTTTETVSVTDARGNTYVDAVSQAQTADGHQIHLFYAKNIAGRTNTVTATFSGTNNHPWLAVYEFSGLDTVSPLDQTAHAQGGDSSPFTGAITTTNSNELEFAATGLPASFRGTVAPGAGYTLELQDTGTSRAANEADVLTTTGQYAGLFNLSNSTNWTAVVATFKAAGTPQPPDFQLSINPASQTVTQGNSTSYTVSVTALNGFSSTVTLSVSNLPPGATGSFNPPSITGSGSSTLSVATTNTAQTGSFTITVTGTSSSGITHSVSATLIINPVSVGSITLVQSNSTEGSGLTSISAAFPSGNHAGNLIVAFVRMSTTSQTVTVADSAGNVYADAVSQGQTADGHQIHIFYAKNIVGGTNRVTASFSATNNHPWIAIYEFSGLNTTSPLDQVAHAQGSGSSANSGPTAAISPRSELIFAATGLPSSYTGTVTAGTGYNITLQDTGTSRAAVEGAISSSGGSYSGVFNQSPGTNWTAAVATFKQ